MRQVKFYYIVIFYYNKTSHSFLKIHPFNKNVKMTFGMEIWIWTSPLSQVIMLSAVHQISQ